MQKKEAAKAKIKGANADVAEVIFDKAGNATVITKDGKVYTIVSKISLNNVHMYHQMVEAITHLMLVKQHQHKQMRVKQLKNCQIQVQQILL